jgi:hypothetical protein
MNAGGRIADHRAALERRDSRAASQRIPQLTKPRFESFSRRLRTR